MACGSVVAEGRACLISTLAALSDGELEKLSDTRRASSCAMSTVLRLPVRYVYIYLFMYRGADKSLARPTSRCILFDGENISFDASLVIYINSTNILPIMIINRIHETQNLLSL